MKPLKFVQHEGVDEGIHPRETVLNGSNVLWFRQVGNVTSIYSRENHLCHAFVSHTEVADALTDIGMELSVIETPDCTYYFNSKAIQAVKPDSFPDMTRIKFNQVMSGENVAVEMVLPMSVETHGNDLKRYQKTQAESPIPLPGC